MISWKKYLKGDGEWASIGGFILEAHINGSWVVRHEEGMVEGRFSAETPAPQTSFIASLNTAKEKAEEALNDMMKAKPNEAMERQKLITKRLCERYKEYRDAYSAMLVGPASLQAEARVDMLGEALDEAVYKYLNTQTT